MSKGTKKDVKSWITQVVEIELSKINYPSPFQTRRRFDGIEGLAQSIRAHGLMNPVIVRDVLGPRSGSE